MDLKKPCWSAEEVALLTTRMIFEDLLPTPNVIKIDCDDFIEDLMCYFRDIIDMIEQETQGRNRHLTLLAFTDLLGGYLHHAILPNARQAFYSGVIQFTSIEKLLQLYEKVKWFLRTNGAGWTKPIENTYAPDVQTIPSETINGCSFGCNQLIYSTGDPIEAKRRRQAIETEESCLNFPLPFFDAKYLPSAIAIPYLHYSLRPIEAANSSYIIMKFFLAGMHCLHEKSASKHSIERFQNNLYTWIEADVVPKLHDDKFYAAFGGVLRVEETLRTLGATEVTLSTETAVSGETESGPDDMAAPAENCEKKKKHKMILIIMLICILLWFLLGALFICYKIRKNRCSCDPPQYPCPKSGASNCECTPKSSRFKFFPSRTGSCCSASATGSISSTCGNPCCPADGKKRNKCCSSSNKTNSQCTCDECPAVLDTCQSMKVLPSISEMTEYPPDRRRTSPNRRRITFEHDDASMSTMSSRENKFQPRQGPDRRCCVPSLTSESNKQCPGACSSSRSRSKSSGATKRKADCCCPQSTTCSGSEYSYANSYACHTSLTGNYEVEKPRIFGYDFHTSSSETEDIDDDLKTSSSK